MDIQEIEVEIDVQGQVNLHVKGLTGTACLALTSDLELVLGNLVLERQMTPEASLLEHPVPLKTGNKHKLNH